MESACFQTRSIGTRIRTRFLSPQCRRAQHEKLHNLNGTETNCLFELSGITKHRAQPERLEASNLASIAQTDLFAFIAYHVNCSKATIRSISHLPFAICSVLSVWKFSAENICAVSQIGSIQGRILNFRVQVTFTKLESAFESEITV